MSAKGMFGIQKSKIDRFLTAWAGKSNGRQVPCLIENPYEEIDEAMQAGNGNLRIHYAVPGQAVAAQALDSMLQQKGLIRGERNYLFSTRRFPSGTDNTLGAGTLAAGSYQFFQYCVGQPLNAGGFPSTINATTNETNLFGTPNVVPNGQGFEIERESVVFNASAKAGDIETLLDMGDLQYQTQSGQYTLYKGGLGGWPGGEGVSASSTGQNYEAASNGIPDLRATRVLTVPRVIMPQQQFTYLYNVGQSVRVTDGTTPVISAFTLMRVKLWGTMLTKQNG
jgi:hypothetical protein